VIHFCKPLQNNSKPFLGKKFLELISLVTKVSGVFSALSLLVMLVSLFVIVFVMQAGEASGFVFIPIGIFVLPVFSVSSLAYLVGSLVINTNAVPVRRSFFATLKDKFK
jgi:hypothetical protein